MEHAIAHLKLFASRGVGTMHDSSSCSDIDEGSTSGGEYFVHGAAGDQCTAGDALFAALRGSGAGPACRQRPQRERRAVEHLLREAALALSQDGDALCHGSLPAPKNKQQTRPALLVLRSREIAAAFLLERDVALAQNRRYWATEWAMREHPDMCRTTEEKDVFLSTVRRWARKAKKGAYGTCGWHRSFRGFRFWRLATGLEPISPGKLHCPASTVKKAAASGRGRPRAHEGSVYW